MLALYSATLPFEKGSKVATGYRGRYNPQPVRTGYETNTLPHLPGIQ